MKLDSLTILTLALAFAGAGPLSSLRAQDASIAADRQRCVNWMKTTVPDLRTPDDADLRKIDPTDFCSGVQSGSVGGWAAVFKCGALPVPLTGTAPRYCTSSGQINAVEAWAAGFSSAAKDGSDFLNGASDVAEKSQRNAATFYTVTAVWMESLRVPAGMYKLIPSKTPDGWSLAVAKQDGEWSDAKPVQQYLGSVLMKGSASDDLVGKHNLAISTSPWAEGCGGLSPDFNFRELHLQYGSTDLFVCIRPEQVSQSHQANISER
jgi:hypothetical protein